MNWNKHLLCWNEYLWEGFNIDKSYRNSLPASFNIYCLHICACISLIKSWVWNLVHAELLNEQGSDSCRFFRNSPGFMDSGRKISRIFPSHKNTFMKIQGGSNMTGTDLCVNKPHCAAAVRPWECEATNSTLPPARVRTCSVLSGSC